MDTPHGMGQGGPSTGAPDGWSVLERQLLGHAGLGVLGGPAVSDLASLAQERARWALQVVVPPAGRFVVEVASKTSLESARGADAEDNASGTSVEPATGDPEPAVDAEPGDAEPATGDPEPAGEAAQPIAPVPHGSVVAVDAAVRARGGIEADLIEAATQVVAECRARILDRRDLVGVELSPATARSVGAAVRQAAVMELELVTGTSTAEATVLAAVATCGGELRAMLLGALRRGQARWTQVKTFWERTTHAHLTTDQRLLVAYALFGTDTALACEERLDPDGALDTTMVWAHHPYQGALGREITACLGRDPEADAARRRRAYENRRVEIRFHDDGTGMLTLTGPAVMIAGIRHRLDAAARALRAAGEERTLAQLRFDLAVALHLHGILDLPDIDVDTLDEVLTPERLADLLAVIHAQPKVHAQVIVPADILKTGLPLCPACAEHIHPTTQNSDSSATADTTQNTDSGGDADTQNTENSDSDSDSTDDTGAAVSTGRRDQAKTTTDPGGDTGPDDTFNLNDDDTHDDRADDDDDVDLDDAGQAHPVTPWGQAEQTGTNPPTWAGPPPEDDDSDSPQDDAPLQATPEATPADSADGRPAQAPPDAPVPPPQRLPEPEPEPVPAKGPRLTPGPGPACRAGRSGPSFLDREPPGRGMVAELIGAHPMFLTPGQARELFLLPGTTLHRLLTDPADGRLVERTITTYRPDTDMRRQVLAADLYSRAPGSLLTGRALELDHVTPWGTPGGHTTETNLAALDKRPHHEKTIGHWRITIGTRRDLAFTTLLDQHRTTRVHDYNQYLRTAEPDDLAARRDLASQALYAHEIEHQMHLARTADRTTAGDESWISITHTDPVTGHTRQGPHPHTPTTDDILNIPTDNADGPGHVDSANGEHAHHDGDDDHGDDQ